MAVVVIWIICACIGLAIGQQKGRAVEGFLLGLVLGLIGVLIIVIMKPSPGFQADRVQPMPSNYMPPISPATSTQNAVPLSQISSTGNLTDALRELEQLRTDGVLSESEFASMKKKILGI